MNRSYAIVLLCASWMVSPLPAAQVLVTPQRQQPPPPPQPVQAPAQPPQSPAPVPAPVVPAPLAPAADVASAATRPSVAADAGSATQPSISELHRRAVELMRQGEWAKAVEPMARVYRALPFDQQPRAVILNQAILDVKVKTNAQRAVRDLTQYLSKHREVDELATNVLGSALDVIADRKGMKKTPLFQKGVAEWERRNTELQEGRPGSHRWGAEWLTDDDYAHLEKLRQEAKLRVADQQAVVERARWRFNVQLQTVRGLNADANAHPSNTAGATGFGTMLPDESIVGSNSIGNVGNAAAVNRRLHDRNGNLINNGANSVAGPIDTSGDTSWADRAMARGQLNRELPLLDAARKELAAEQAKLATEQDHFPKPYWPSEYPPVEPE